MRPADRREIARLTRPLVASGLFTGADDVLAVWEREPWRVGVTEDREIVLTRRHGHLPLLLIEGLWCEEARVPALVDALAPVAEEEGCERLVSPVVDGPGARAYQSAGMHVDRAVVALRHPGPVTPPSGGVALVEAGSDADAGDVLRLDAEAFEPFWRFDREWLDRTLSGGRLSLVRERDGLVGYALSRVRSGEGHIARLAIHPGRRGQGLGRALVRDALSHLASAGAGSVTVNTQAENSAARELYRAAGFRESAAPLLVLISDML